MSGNHERWLISYADLLTLLFAFFIVLFATSTPDSEKLAAMSSTLTEGDKSGTTMEGEVAKVIDGAYVSDLQQIVREMHERVHTGDDQVMIRNDTNKIRVILSSDVMFGSGSATLSHDARKIITSLAEPLLNTTLKVEVHGHSDSVPIRSAYFPSNWELSAARGGAVARVLEELNFPKKHLRVVGYADGFPIGNNDTPEGRARNRRVEIVIFKEHLNEFF